MLTSRMASGDPASSRQATPAPSRTVQRQRPSSMTWRTASSIQGREAKPSAMSTCTADWPATAPAKANDAAPRNEGSLPGPVARKNTYVPTEIELETRIWPSTQAAVGDIAANRNVTG